MTRIAQLSTCSPKLWAAIDCRSEDSLYPQAFTTIASREQRPGQRSDKCIPFQQPS